MEAGPAQGTIAEPAGHASAEPAPHFRDPPMITVHHLNQSRSHRVLWMLEELSLPYELTCYERDRDTLRAPASLKAVHALGKSPVITDGTRVVAESGAILEYLQEAHGEGRLRPAPGTDEALRCRYWLHYAEGSAMPPLLLKLVFDRIEKAPMPFFIKPVAKGIARKAKESFILPQIRTHLDFIEAELAQGPWFAGREFSLADIQMSFPLEAAMARAGSAGQWPRIEDFLRRIHERPAYQRAVQRGGAFSIPG